MDCTPRLADVLPVGTDQGLRENLHDVSAGGGQATAGTPTQHKSSEPKLLEIPAAVQRTNEQALRAAYEASGGAELGDSTNWSSARGWRQSLEIIPASVATRAMTMIAGMALIFEDYW